MDADGRFEMDMLHDDVENIEFHDRFQGTHIRTLSREILEPDGDGWIARIAIGPSYRLQLLGVESPRWEDWHARLTEILASGIESRGSWIPVRPVEAPFMRYDNLASP